MNDGVPVETVGLLQRACADRDVGYHEIDAGSFDFDQSERCGPGDLLYRPAVAARAFQTELFLYGPGVASFHSDDPFFVPTHQVLAFERSGLPTPRAVPGARMGRDALRDIVERLGGLPIVIKVGGYEGGVGVLVADTWRSTFSTLDYLWATGVTPLLAAYVPDAVHWRVVVVGDRAVAAYQNDLLNDDFRSTPSLDLGDYIEDPPTGLAGLAIDATRVLRRELAGVDILEHPSGRRYLLEANFPCYFAHAQLVAGFDIAGAMVDHLMGKSVAG